MKLLAILLVIAALLGVVIGFAIITDNPAFGMALIAGGPIGVAALFMLVRYLDTGAHQRHDQQVESAFRDELPQLQRADYALPINGSSGLVRALLTSTLVAGLWYLALNFVDKFSRTDHSIAIGATATALIFLTVAVAVWLLVALSKVGHPVILLTREGFQTPLTGRIPWQAVNGIALQTHRGRDQDIIGHTLVFQVPLLADFINQFAFVAQQLHQFRFGDNKTRVSVTLRRTKVDPEVVSQIAHELFSRATGRRAIWYPDLSKEFNNEIIPINAQKAHGLTSLVRQDPEKLLAATDQFLRISAAIEKEHKRLTKKHSGSSFCLSV